MARAAGVSRSTVQRIWDAHGLQPQSRIQALDRTQPGLPMKPGRCGTMTHDYLKS